MREILFKAKNMGDGKWVEGYYLYYDNEHIIIETTENGILYHKIDFNTLCQYTGLTDKNGNKIWENDIIGTDVGNVKVAYVTDPSPYENHYNAGFEVLFANVTDNENYRHDLGYWTILRGFEAVGNTFDNPELWK
jgi:uncharacterized phage protein (TIGR01671 family)